MTLEIRRLDPTEDELLFKLAYRWLYHSPHWRRDTEEVFGTTNFTEYMAATHDSHRIDIGVFEDDQLTAIVIFTLRAKDTYEVHLEAPRSADPATIVEAGCHIRDQIFGWYNARLVYAWVPRLNTSVIAILQAIAFQPTHVSMLRTTPRGRVTEWVQLSIEANYGQQEAEHTAIPNPIVQRHEHLWVANAS